MGKGAYNGEEDVDDGGGLEVGEQARAVELHFVTGDRESDLSVE